MRFTSAIAPIVALIGAAQASETPGVAYVTVITTDYTTYCPVATTFAHKNVTYTATASETLTITNCPCTITTTPPQKPTVLPPAVSSSTIVIAPGTTTVVPVPVQPSQPGQSQQPGESTQVTQPGQPGQTTQATQPGQSGQSESTFVPSETLGNVRPITTGTAATNVPSAPTTGSTYAPSEVPVAGANRAAGGFGAMVIAAGAALFL